MYIEKLSFLRVCHGQMEPHLTNGGVNVECLENKTGVCLFYFKVIWTDGICTCILIYMPGCMAGTGILHN